MFSQRLKRLFPIAIIASLAACSGGSQGANQALPAVSNATPGSATPMSSTSSSGYNNAILGENPVAFYPLSDAAPTAYDQSGHNLNGSIGASVTTGLTGLAASSKADKFPGLQSSAGVIKVSANSLLQPSGSASLEALFSFSSTPVNYTVLAGYGQRSGIASYEFYFKNGQLIAQFTTTSGFVDISTPVSSNVAYDAVATYDGSYARLYLNGKLAASAALTGSLKYVSGYGLTIGDDTEYIAPAFNGTIGAVSVFATALSASQAAANYAAVNSTSTGTPAPTATPQPTTAPTATPTTAPTSVPSGNVVWKAGDSTLGKWMVSNTYQCGTPVNTGTQFAFNLVKNGTNCGRNQMLPLTSGGSTFYLQDGATYTWQFRYIDGKPDGSGPGMGLDTGIDPEANLWQIHGNVENDSPCTGLDFENGSYFSGSLGAGQQWSFSTCNGYKWFGKYTPGEVDDFKIVATIANADISSETYGETKLYRNGVLVMDDHGPNYHHSQSSPARSWWNFGIYKWRWELTNSNSNLTNVNATFQNMILTQQ